MTIAVRKAAWVPGGPANGWSDDLLWYAAAIHQMKIATPRLDDLWPLAVAFASNQGVLDPAERATANAIIGAWSDPRSLGYQAQVHDTIMAANKWPSHLGTTVLWKQCAHNNWFFLPWHRAYLVEFERVVRGHISDLGGPSETWALPYWNYSDYLQYPRATGLPLPLRGESLPAGVTVPGVEEVAGSFPNPLFDPTRDMTGDIGPRDSEGELWTDASNALIRLHYANRQDDGQVSFGGGYLEDITKFHLSREAGRLDASPHGSVHVQVSGHMALFQTAGLDPVFWMHHANIDRLWETYARDLEHRYPFEDGTPVGPERDSWVSQAFAFLRPEGTVFTWTAPEVLDVAALGYAYDTTAPPPLQPTEPLPPGGEIGPFGLVTDVPVPVAAASDVTVVDTRVVELLGGSGDDGLGLGADSALRWVLRFDGIRSARPALTSYHVYLGLEPDAPAEPSDAAHFVGLLSLFGVFEASLDDGASPGSGQLRTFDVSELVSGLGSAFDPLSAVLRLVPLNPDRALETVELSIGRISLDVA